MVPFVCEEPAGSDGCLGILSWTVGLCVKSLIYNYKSAPSCRFCIGETRALVYACVRRPQVEGASRHTHEGGNAWNLWLFWTTAKAGMRR